VKLRIDIYLVRHYSTSCCVVRYW